MDINAGYGQATLERSDFDQLNNLNINKDQRNIYAGLQYHVGPLTWVAELALLEQRLVRGQHPGGELLQPGSVLRILTKGGEHDRPRCLASVRAG